MRIETKRQLEATREKLGLLEDSYDLTRREKAGDAHVRGLTLRSLKRMINQLKEEIARCEAHMTIRDRSE